MILPGRSMQPAIFPDMTYHSRLVLVVAISARADTALLPKSGNKNRHAMRIALLARNREAPFGDLCPGAELPADDQPGAVGVLPI
jgi:hypothetical protein